MKQFSPKIRHKVSVVKNNPYTYGLFFILMSLLMLGPALKPGYLFLLDMPWPEKLGISNLSVDGFKPHTPIIALLSVMNTFIASWVLQKALLLGIIASAGFGMSKLLKNYNVTPLLTLLGGIIYIFNPFVSSRLLAGQWLVLAGYAFAPFFAKIIIDLYKHTSRKNLVVALAAWTLYAALSVHYWYVVSLILLPVLIYSTYAKPHPQTHLVWPKTLFLLSSPRNLLHVGVALAAIVLFVVIIYSKTLSTITNVDFEVFSTTPINFLGVLGAVLTLRGFWYSDGGIPASAEALWLIVCVIFVSLSSFVLYRLYSKNRYLGLYALAVLALLTVAAIGYGSSVGIWVTNIFRHILPGYNGMRDTQKLVGIIAFVYAFCVPYALSRAKVGRNSIQIFGTTIVLSLYAVCAATMVVGNYNAFHSYAYPSGWKNVQSLLQKHNSGDVLALPWESYINLPFARDQRVSNPARLYFGENVFVRVSNDNPLLDELADAGKDNTVLSLKRTAAALPSLADQGFRYILLINSGDAESYRQVLQDAKLQSIYSDNDLELYSL